MVGQIFSVASAMAMVGWLVLILAPHWRGVPATMAGIVIPALLSLAYLVLIGVWWSRAEGGFGSIDEVRALFRSTPILVAGWLHYLAFDLFVGAWIASQARREGISRLRVAPILVLTFLFGPIGFLAFLAVRWSRRASGIRQAGAGGLASSWSRFAEREPALVATGLVFLVAMVPTLLAALVDDRTLDGVGVWAKPLKFEASLSLFAFSLAWFFPMASASFRRSAAGRFAVWGFILPAALELAYIAWRASRGEASHFNQSSVTAAVQFGLMGIGAVLLTAAAPALAYGIARRDAPPAAPATRLAAILGLVLTFALGGTEGLLMAAHGAHSVGPAGAGGAVPVLGWLRGAGDLRVAHFLGIHAQQLIPLAGAVIVATLGGERRGWVAAFAAAYALLFLATLLQALAGQPLLPG